MYTFNPVGVNGELGMKFDSFYGNDRDTDPKGLN